MKNASSESESEYEESSSSDESYSKSESDSEETRSDELIQRQQKTKPNPARAPYTRICCWVSFRIRFTPFVKIRFGLKQQEKESRDSKRAKKPNEDAPIGSSENEQNAILLGSTIVSLGRDDSGNLIVDGPPITESQPSIHSVPEPPQQPAPQEEQPLQQPPDHEEQPSQQPHTEEEIIDISSSSEDEHEPTPFIPLIPKAEEEQPHEEEHPEENNPSADEEQRPEGEGRPVQNQSIVEVIPIYPTQEVIDISSSDDETEPTPIPVLIPKSEVDHVNSPRAKSITEVLLSMSQDHPTHSEPDDAPLFDLGIDYGKEPPPIQEERLLTTQLISEIEELDELIKEKENQFQTPQPTQRLNIRNELHDRVTIWAMVPTGDNEYESIFKLSGPKFLEAIRYQFISMRPEQYIDIQVVSIMCHTLNMEQSERFQKQVYCVPPEILTRMLGTHGHNWMDKKKRKPHDIGTMKNHEEYKGYLDKDRLLTHRFLFAPVLFSKHSSLYVLDVAEKELFVLDSKNIKSPGDERTEVNRFASNILDQLLRWAGGSSMFKKGTHSLLAKYINVPGQPNEHDYGVYIMKWMEFIDPTVLKECSSSNKEYNIETWTEPKLDEFRKDIVAKIMLSESNAWRMETMRKANGMRNTRPAVVLRNPYL
ncbi:hypothetical protein PIB30_046060 [Stylosanthes scabra]|uniref:Ubiquitin-like protease family profile domain-containing protein n=1 Tax=Stylosanthes scabra TaxID=79078 RepID=A0ABU6SHV7_9FABA|nr:hypothetical protein [Stylosanthes scabra]